MKTWKDDFQTVISFIGDNILITYFDSYYESIIEGVQKNKGIKYNINKKNKGFAGAIVAIVLVCIVCIGALIVILLFLRKKNVNQDNQEESANKTFN